MGTESVAHIHNEVLFSHKENEIVLYRGKWIELEIIMLSEICQRQKILSHIYHESLKTMRKQEGTVW